MIAPSLDYIPEDKSSLKKFGKMIDKLWRNLSATFASFFLAAAPYTPVATASVGAFTTVSATGRFYQLGRLVFVQIAITITTNGTAATSVLVTLPSIPVVGAKYVINGRADTVSGKMLQARTTATSFEIFNYDNTYPGASGETLVLSGFYETS